MDKRAFLERVEQAADIGSGKESERRALAVVVALAHLASDTAQRRRFISQLPGFLKSGVLDEWPTAPVAWSRDAFVQHVAAALGTHAAQAEIALRGVYTVLQEAISPGEIADFEAGLPHDIRALLHRP